ncbi:MAG: zinc metallopeptidase [Oscillospiraceae bacterium]|nr:zinc metallopeptidase [Oscillospiraceae bacterium]
MMFNYYYDSSYVFYMLITLAISMYAHFKVQNTFSKYSKIKTSKNITGLDSAKQVLLYNNVCDVPIKHIKGNLNDNFNPAQNAIFLSDPVYSNNSVSAAGVAAHEAGHAVQNAQGYIPIKIRQFLVPITQLGSNLSMPLVFIGLLLPVQYHFIVNLGIILFSLAVVFQIITLPVEINASKRAMLSLQNANMLSEKELKGAKEVLNAAALTYVAAAFTAIISLLRLILISQRRK